jgi:hypothetical protein
MLLTIVHLLDQIEGVDTIAVPKGLIEKIPQIPDIKIVVHDSPHFFFKDDKGEILSVQNIPLD